MKWHQTKEIILLKYEYNSLVKYCTKHLYKTTYSTGFKCSSLCDDLQQVKYPTGKELYQNFNSNWKTYQYIGDQRLSIIYPREFSKYCTI